MKINFIIPGTLPTMNEILAASKSHFAIYSKMKKKYTNLVVLSCNSIPIIDHKFSLLIKYYCPNMKTDPDNISVGKKFILDGMMKAGKIKNDGWKQVKGWEEIFLVDKVNPRIEIEVF